MAKLICHTAFDYRFPSGSLVAFKASDDAVTTKREIVDYAIAKGYGVDPEAKARPAAKIAAGLNDAIAYTEGDKSKGVVSGG